MPFGFPTGVAGGALSAAGIEIPKGDPGQILHASTRLKATASKLEDGAASLGATGRTAILAEGWDGPASAAFASVTGELGSAMEQGAEPLRQAAAACRTFAAQLKECQEAARHARRAGHEAHARGQVAAAAMERASAACADAGQEAGHAAIAAGQARGTADVAGAAHADQRERDARAREGRARADADRARAALDGANEDVRSAIRRAEHANERAEAAGRRARAIFEDVAAAATTARVSLGPVPVPVSATPGDDPLAGPRPFELPFRALTPGDVRRRELEEEAQRAREAGENPPLNDMQKWGRRLFSTGFAPVDGITLGGAGKLLHLAPGGKRLYGSDAGGAKVTQWIGLGHAAERGAVKGAKAIGDRLPTGPMEPIFRRHPADRLPPMARQPRERITIERGPDGSLRRADPPSEPRGRSGTESRKAEDGRRQGAKQTSGDRREAASLAARVGVNVEKAIDNMHLPPPGGF